ncbi:MAG: hypothetical protein ACI915_001988 [Gammaproteobacteria bacterium]|jgi:hypothetical protein
MLDTGVLDLTACTTTRLRPADFAPDSASSAHCNNAETLSRAWERHGTALMLILTNLVVYGAGPNASLGHGDAVVFCAVAGCLAVFLRSTANASPPYFAPTSVSRCASFAKTLLRPGLRCVPILAHRRGDESAQWNLLRKLAKFTKKATTIADSAASAPAEQCTPRTPRVSMKNEPTST